MEFFCHHADGQRAHRGPAGPGGGEGVLGRTMWEFPGGRTGGNRYPVLGFGSGEPVEVGGSRNELIAYGPLLSDDGEAWLGTAVLLRAPDAEAARVVLTVDRYDGVEVHRWPFGGRPA